MVRPGTRQAEPARREARGELVNGRDVAGDVVVGEQVLEPRVPDVGLRADGGGRCLVGDVGRPRECDPRVGVGEQLTDQRFGARVVALTEPDVTDDPVRVDQIVGGPVLVVVGVPRVVAVVDGDRIVHAELRGLGAHVRDHMLEGELGGVHPHHHEPVLRVGLVPGLDVGKRALAVDARVGPEVHQDDLAPQSRECERLAARCVQPRGDPLERRRLAAAHQSGGGRLATGERGVAVAGEVAELLANGGRSLDSVLQRARVSRHIALQRGEHVQADGQGHADEDDSAHLAQPGPAFAQHLHPFGELVAGQRDREQRNRGSRPERDGEEHCGQTHMMGCADDGDRGQDRAGTRDEQHAEAQPEDEPAGLPAWLARADPRERALQKCGQRREDEPEADEDQQGDAGVAEEVLGQVEEGDDLGTGQDQQAEAQDQPTDHRQRPGSGLERWRGARSGCTGHEDHRKHREDAGRDAGDDPGYEADPDELDHPMGPPIGVRGSRPPTSLLGGSRLVDEPRYRSGLRIWGRGGR